MPPRGAGAVLVQQLAQLCGRWGCQVGVASTMFRVLSEEGINIQMISTSEIKTSVVIDEKYVELAVRSLHKAFDLDQQAT